MEQTLKVIFPLIYGKGVKDSIVATQLYEMVIKYLQN